MPRTIIVAAVGRNGVIGVDGGLPWRIPDDMARFREMTMGHTLVMGRSTFESIGRVLPGRTTIVLTRTAGWAHDGVEVAATLETAILAAHASGRDAFIAGGAEVYRAGLEFADVLEITEVEAAPEGDTYFPTVDWERWRETGRDNRDGFAFVTYERV